MRSRGTRRITGSAWLVPTGLASAVLLIVSAAAATALETNTVGSLPRGLWWALSLITTVGFIGEPPETVAGAALSAVLMIVGFLMLAMVSASLAALFVREEEEEPNAALEGLSREILARIQHLEDRLDLIAPLEEPPPDHRRDRTDSPPVD